MRHLSKQSGMVLLFAGASLAFGSAQAQVNIRFNDYNGGATTHPAYSFVAAGNAGISTPVQGYAGIGVGSNQFSGNLFRNIEANPTIGSGGTFSNLPLGGSLSFSFLLAAIDSWDGLDVGGPDRFELIVNGSTVYTTSFDNFPGPATSTNGGTLLSSGSNLGFGRFFDSAWDFTNVAGLQNIGYAGTSVTYAFRATGEGWSGGDDESWGLDNFRVNLTLPAVTPVPEPETYALMLAGLGAVGFVARRRRKA
jgi:hypothetical protein